MKKRRVMRLFDSNIVSGLEVAATLGMAAVAINFDGLP